MRVWHKIAVVPVVLAVCGMAVFYGLDAADRAYPPPLDKAAVVSAEVVDADGQLLRAFAMPDGRWRLATTARDVDPQFLRMLVAYEDRRFYQHGGVDLRAFLRAAGQFVGNGRIVSGASTLSMQVARLIEPREARSFAAKLGQVLRAIQIERRLSKEEILDLYLTLAPYGGNLEGVRAASLAYFGKEPRRLSVSEAALLVALPQSPEARRPDRHGQAALLARGRVLARDTVAETVGEAAALQASLAPVPTRRLQLPAYAAHLAEAAIRKPVAGNNVGEADAAREVLASGHVGGAETDERGVGAGRALDGGANGGTGRRYVTTLRRDVQRGLEEVAQAAIRRLGPKISLAMVMADARTGEIVGHVGSADYFDASRSGWIDMTRVNRSPGSTLKPFIYGLAFEQGLVAQETVIEDRPADFSGYRPRNFDMRYQGDVSIRQALQLSLNVPAIRLLDAVGPSRLMMRFRRAHVRPALPAGETPGLAIGLGGAGITLKDLVQLYAGLANRGVPMRLGDGVREQPEAAVGDPLLEPVAAWNVTDILSDVLPPQGSRRLGIAYKTGTSYGYRDAWSVGYDGRYVLGIWVGRPDNGAVPGIAGYATAAPILFEAFSRSGVAITPLPSAPPGAVRLAQAELPINQRRFSVTASGLISASAREPVPQIVYPPEGARVDLGALEGGALTPLTLKLQGGRAPFRWLANGRPLEQLSRRRTSEWTPEGGGYSTLTVIDAVGRAATVRVFVE